MTSLYALYAPIAAQAAREAGIDPDIYLRQIGQESGWDSDVINGTRRSSTGATGINQFMPGTASGLGVNPLDPRASLEAGAKLMAGFVKQYGGDYSKALAAYNAGPGAVEKYGGVPPYQETRDYVTKILGSGGGATGPQQTGSSMTPEQIQQAKQALALALEGPPYPAAGNQPAETREQYQARIQARAASIQSDAAGRLTFINPAKPEAGLQSAQATSDGAGGGTYTEYTKDKAGGFSPGNIPVGYSFDANSNTYYKNTAQGPVPVDSSEVEQAAVRQAQNATQAKQPQGFQIQSSTGDLYTTDPATGTTKLLIKGFAQPGISEADAAKETARINANALQENARQSDNRETTSRRNADLSAATSIYQTKAGLIPQFADIALKESEQMRQVLSQGGDFLYRAFKSQGQDSPLPLVTQSDLIGHLKQQLAQLTEPTAPNISQYGGDLAGFNPGAAYQAPGPYSGGTMVAQPPAAVTPASAAAAITPKSVAGFMGEPSYNNGQAAALWAAQAAAAPATAAPGGGGGGPDYFQMDANDQSNSSPIGGAVGFGGGGGPTTMPAPVRLPAPTTSSNSYRPSQEAAPSTGFDLGAFGRWLGAGAAIPARGVATAAAPAWGALAPALGALGSMFASRNQLQDRFGNGGMYAEGTHGFVTDPQFIAGDPQPGQPTGNPEKITLALTPDGRPAARVEPLSGPAAGGQAQAPARVDPEQQRLQKGTDAKLKALLHIEDPALMHAMVDDINKGRSKLRGFSTGTPDASSYGWDPVKGFVQGGAAITGLGGDAYSLGTNVSTSSGQTASSSKTNPAYGAKDTSGYQTPVGVKPAPVGTGINTPGTSWSLGPWGAVNWNDGASVNSFNDWRTSHGFAPYGYQGSLDDWKTEQAAKAEQAAFDATPAGQAAKAAKAQAELVALADRTLPPAIRRINEQGGGTVTAPGTKAPPIAAGGPLARTFDMPLPTLQELNSLSKEEAAAADTYYRLKYQTPLSDIVDEVQRRYAPGFSGAGTLRGPGL